MQPYTGKLRGVFHCFGGSLDQANEVSILITSFRSRELSLSKTSQPCEKSRQQIRLWKFMVETDCPYLAPVPFRGKRCEPAHTRIVAEAIAAARHVAVGRNCRSNNRNRGEVFQV